MSWKLLAETYLASTKRKREIRVETESDYGKWVTGVDKEMEIFFNQAHELDLTESTDRRKLDKLVEKLASRLEHLRDNQDAHQAPSEVLVKLEKFIDYLNGLSEPHAASSRTSLKKDPWKEARRERERQEREKNEIKSVSEDRNEIADRIISLRNSLEGEK